MCCGPLVPAGVGAGPVWCCSANPELTEIGGGGNPVLATIVGGRIPVLAAIGGGGNPVFAAIDGGGKLAVAVGRFTRPAMAAGTGFGSVGSFIFGRVPTPGKEDLPRE